MFSDADLRECLRISAICGQRVFICSNADEQES
jgi:hypothetical protein